MSQSSPTTDKRLETDITGRKCEVCGSSRNVSLAAPWPVLRCLDCGLVYARDLDPPKGSDDLYEESFAKGVKHPTYMFDGSKYMPRGMDRWATLLMRLENYKKSRRILDIGCSLGFLLHQAQGLGWEAFGLEVSEYASKYASEQFGIHMHRGFLEEDTYPAEFFDAVICSHVLEHVPSPRVLIGLIRKILRPGGAALILVPTQFSSPSYRFFGRLRGVGPPLHLHFFSRKTLGPLLKQEGFQVHWTQMNTQLAYLLGDMSRSKGIETRLEQQSEELVSEASRTVPNRIKKIGVRLAKTVVNRVGTFADFGDELIVLAQRR